MDRHQRRLWKNRVTQAEIRLSAFVNNDDTETAIRITVSNVSGTRASGVLIAVPLVQPTQVILMNG